MSKKRSKVQRFNLAPGRTIKWFGDVSDSSVSRVIGTLSGLVADEADRKKPCQILLNSSGGDVYAAFGFYDFVRTIARLNLVVVGLGAIKSGGVVILSTGELRLLSRHSVLWVHEVIITSAVKEKIRSRDLARESVHLEDINNTFARILARSTKGKTSVKDIRQLMKEEKYISAEEAVELGLADGIIGAGGRMRIVN